MRLIAEAIEDLPAECRDLAGNALLNIAAEAVAQDVGCAEAGRIFSPLPISWRAACSRRSPTRFRSMPSMRKPSDCRLVNAGLQCRGERVDTAP